MRVINSKRTKPVKNVVKYARIVCPWCLTAEVVFDVKHGQLKCCFDCGKVFQVKIDD